MQTSSFVLQAIPLIGIFFVFYAIVIRPGRVSEGRRWAAVSRLVPGQRVVLLSGMLATYIRLHGMPDTGEYEIEISDGVVVRVLEDGIKAVLDESRAVVLHQLSPAPMSDQAVLPL